ncbi:MAG: nitroreductase family protein [archaeon]
MNIFDAIDGRRSIRSFLVRPVEFDKISAIIEAGTLAPSAGNLQDWKFIIVSEKEVITKIAESALGQYWIAKAPVLVVVCGMLSRQEKYYGDKGRNVYCAQDCAAAIENMLLTAHALGLGSCWVGGFDEHNLRHYLDIPNSAQPYAILPLGYPDEGPEERHLSPLTDHVFFNKYGRKVEHIHRVLHDWSVEWERQAKKAEPIAKTQMQRISIGVKKAKAALDTYLRKAKEKKKLPPVHHPKKPLLKRRKPGIRHKQLREFDFDYYKK